MPDLTAMRQSFVRETTYRFASNRSSASPKKTAGPKPRRFASRCDYAAAVAVAGMLTLSMPWMTPLLVAMSGDEPMKKPLGPVGDEG